MDPANVTKTFYPSGRTDSENGSADGVIRGSTTPSTPAELAVSEEVAML